jgi:hypothetical protein
MKADESLHLFTSIFVCLIVAITVSSSVSYNFIENKTFNNGRYGITYDSLETIAKDDALSVIAIGSSMMYKAVNGTCLRESSLVEDAMFYNLAITAAKPYNYMLKIPRIINSDIDIVMLEVGVNLFTEYKKPVEGERGDEYLEMRFTIDTMLQSDADVGKWVDIVLPFHEKWLNLNEFKRNQARQLYTIEGSELILERLVGSEEKDTLHYWKVPEIDTQEWIYYLQEPPWPVGILDGMTEIERIKYSDNEMSKSKMYHPLPNGTANHAALHYEISELTNAGIKVILVGLPHHPEIFQYLDAGQWDGYNQTIQELTLEYGVDYVDFTFSEGWKEEHFSDRNHLDKEGRIEFCQRMTPILNAALEE